LVTFNSKAGNRLHPTEKPVPLLRYLTELFSNPGDLVLDPFAGSASMGETALLTNRQAILVEQDADFFAKGSARVISIASQRENQII
jgi:site-specific DNA-methyltransferase (adenine-specific)